MIEIKKIKINNQVSVQLEGGNILIYKNGHLRCSGFEDSVDYLEFHCYFNDIDNKEFYSILKAFQNYYTSNVLQKNKKEQLKLTGLLSAIHTMVNSHKYCLQFFKKLVKDKKFQNNYYFWEVVFKEYYGSGHDSVVKLAYRRLLRINPYNKDLWSLLTEFYDISCRSAVVKKILSDIERNTQIKG